MKRYATMLSEFTGVVPSTFLSKLFQNSVSTKSTYQLVEYKIKNNPIGRQAKSVVRLHGLNKTQYCTGRIHFAARCIPQSLLVPFWLFPQFLTPSVRQNLTALHYTPTQEKRTGRFACISGIRIGAILVAVRADRMLHQMNSLDMETKGTGVTIDVVKEQVVNQLEILLRVYRDTTGDVHFPTEANLQEVSARLFFVDERVSLLHNIYCDLISQGTQSEYFLQVIQVLGGKSKQNFFKRRKERSYRQEQVKSDRKPVSAALSSYRCHTILYYDLRVTELPACPEVTSPLFPLGRELSLR
ncbi:hypothetical protein AB3S75_033436 [Citrus x aurantiifolia]